MKEFIIRKRENYVQITCRIEKVLLDRLEKLSAVCGVLYLKYKIFSSLYYFRLQEIFKCLYTNNICRRSGISMYF